MCYHIERGTDHLNIDSLKALLKQTYWANNRTDETIKKSVENSVCFCAYEDESDSLIGFARVITDFSTTFYICDVIVDELHRGHGVAKSILQCIDEQEDIAPHLGLLVTTTAKGLYEKFGFCDQENSTTTYMGRPRKK